MIERSLPTETPGRIYYRFRDWWTEMSAFHIVIASLIVVCLGDNGFGRFIERQEGRLKLIIIFQITLLQIYVLKQDNFIGDINVSVKNDFQLLAQTFFVL